jgi:hypothetical protein
MDDMTTSNGQPDAPRHRVHSVTLYIMLSQDFGSSTGYDAQEGERHASCAAKGYVWNTESKFQSKRCNVTFRRHATGLLPEFANEHGLDGACGSIQVASRLEPERFDADGEEVSLPPIEIHIVLDDSGYDRTEKLLRACLTTDREASLSLEFSHRDFTQPWMELDDLDLATKSTYPIVSFNLGGVRQDNTTVNVPKYKYDAETAASLTFTATAASIQASVWNSAFSVSEIKLTGKLRSQKLGITSDDDTMEIKEYEENRGWKPGYPEEAFPGVVAVSRKETITYCWITLYATRDIMKWLARLLSGLSKGDTVRFDISIIAEGLPLKVDETKEFNVTGYTPVLLKSYA